MRHRTLDLESSLIIFATQNLCLLILSIVQYSLSCIRRTSLNLADLQKEPSRALTLELIICFILLDRRMTKDKSVKGEINDNGSFDGVEIILNAYRKSYMEYLHNVLKDW